MEYRVDFCLSIEEAVKSTDEGIVEKVIPILKCALARDVGSRTNNQASERYFIEKWLPKSGEVLSGFPINFHYVNVGHYVKEHKAITGAIQKTAR